MGTTRLSTAEIGQDMPTVLLVDDNPHNLKVLYETLRDRDYRLLIANDGEKALALAQRSQPELILLDIMMPGMDGYEVCRRLKKDPNTAGSAVVFLSALDDLDAKVRGFELGGVDYIAKPFQTQEVIARVDTHVRVIRLERALQARNRELENDQARILYAINEGIYGLDGDGIIAFANPAAATMLQCSIDELIGSSFYGLHFPRLAGDGVVPAMATCTQGVLEHQRGVTMSRPDDSTFVAEYQATPKREAGVLCGAVVVFRDITVELAREEELANARSLLANQRDQLAHASRLSTVGEMAAGFAHEVNQPLTAISNYVRVALRMAAQAEPDKRLLEQTLTKIEAQAHRASEVIRRIRGFVRKPASGRELIDVAQMLDDIRQFAEVDMRHNRGQIQVEIAAGLPSVIADPIQVQQVALNLVRNALEATRTGGREDPVLVRASLASARFVRIDVEDRGCGLPPDAEERLFLPFFTTKQEGMGIGLVLCRSLVQSQGGDIGFERREGGGTRFYFTLPVVDS